MLASQMDIHVTFVDADTDRTLASQAIPATQLPDRIDIHTTVRLGDDEWEIVEADLVTRSEFERSGSLCLRMRRRQAVTLDPRQIRFSTPTLCSELPPLDDRASSVPAGVFELHEDDWRDVELVSIHCKQQIDANFAAIRQVYERSGDGVGFTEVHVRREPRTPLLGSDVTLDDIFLAFGTQLTAFPGLRIRGAPGLVARGFAFATQSLRFYGHSTATSLASIGVDPWKATGDVTAEADALTKLMTRHHLTVIVWRQCRQIDDNDQLVSWLEALASRQ